MSTKAKAQGLFDPADHRRRRPSMRLRKLDPRELAQEPGDLRHRGGLGRRDRLLHPRSASRTRTRRCSRARSRSGSGSRCCSPISPKRWRRGAARRRRRRLRKSRSDTRAKRYVDPKNLGGELPEASTRSICASATSCWSRPGDIIPGDGEIIEGLASVNESAITGESAPVIREAGGDRSAVTGGTTVLSDQIKVRITAAAGSTFIDRMIALVEGAERQKTPNELALSILLSGLTLIFLIVCVTLWPLAGYSGTVLSVTVLIALLVCLIPTTIGGLLSAIGIAGMDRLIRFNVIATSGRAVEAAGDVDTLLLDKTGTITFGNRMADEFVAVAGVSEARAGRGGAGRRASPTRRRRAARSSRWPRAATASRRRRSRPRADRAVHRADPHLRRRSAGPRTAQGRGRRDPRAGRA